MCTKKALILKFIVLCSRLWIKSLRALFGININYY
ncbi:hypothetical protein [Escherichia phage vB_EcoP_EP32B]|nr:hypothetical protein [Escherichia phage vB_EcoP_EP32B]